MMHQTQPPKRPATVSTALLLIYGSMALSIIHSLLIESLPSIPDSELVPRWVVLAASALGICVFLGIQLTLILITHRAGQGKNWARIVLLIIEGGGFALVTLIYHEPPDPVYDLATCVALLLLFHPRSSRWFKSMQSHREAFATN